MKKAKADLEVKSKAFEELEKTNKKIQEDLKTAQKQDLEQKQKIQKLEEDLKKVTEEKTKLQGLSDERLKTVEKMDSDVKEAASTLIKLEEARIVLNKLLGPGGSFTEQEREKYLKNAKGAGSPEAKIGPSNPGGAALASVGATAPSNKALQVQSQNQQFIYENKSNRGKNLNQYGAT